MNDATYNKLMAKDALDLLIRARTALNKANDESVTGDNSKAAILDGVSSVVSGITNNFATIHLAMSEGDRNACTGHLFTMRNRVHELESYMTRHCPEAA